MAKERKQVEQDIATIVFYMQGGLSYNDAFMLSSEQLEILYKTVHEHYERQNNALNSNKKQ